MISWSAEAGLPRLGTAGESEMIHRPPGPAGVPPARALRPVESTRILGNPAPRGTGVMSTRLGTRSDSPGMKPQGPIVHRRPVDAVEDQRPAAAGSIPAASTINGNGYRRLPSRVRLWPVGLLSVVGCRASSVIIGADGGCG